MPFDKNKVPPFMQDARDSYSMRCAEITPGASDQVDPTGKYYKYFVAATPGDVTFVAMRDGDADTRTMTLAAGQVLPGRVRRITAATATVHGWF